MKRALLGWMSLSLLAAGCTGFGPSQKPGALSITNTVTLGRTLSVRVNAPTTLAGVDGKIVSEQIASVVSAGGGNVVSAGGGNVVSAGALNFRLSAAADAYTPVGRAFVYLEDTLTGQPVGKALYSGDDGAIQLTDVPDNRALSAIARFKVNGKDYRLAVPVAFGTAAGPVVADPINTIVESRVRQILRANGRADKLNYDQLAKVWTVFNDADVTIDLDTLENGRSLEDLFAFYDKLIGQLDPEKDAAGIKAVKDYMASIKGETK